MEVEGDGCGWLDFAAVAAMRAATRLFGLDMMIDRERGREGEVGRAIVEAGSRFEWVGAIQRKRWVSIKIMVTIYIAFYVVVD